MARGQIIYTNGGVLRDKRRARIVSIVERLGQATYSELQKILDLGNGVMQYHLLVLEGSGVLVKENGCGRERPYRLSRNYLGRGIQPT